MSKTSIIGAYNTKFGSFVEKNRETGEIKDTKSFYALIEEAGKGAIEDAGISPEEIDGIWIGSCSPSKFINQEHVAPLGLEVAPKEMKFVPTFRTESACASSSVALYNAAFAVESGRFKRVLVIGVEKMNLLSTPDVTHALACSSYWPDEGANGMTFPGLFAELAKGYMEHYKYSLEQMQEMFAHVSALSYKNGFKNPLAHFSKGAPPHRLGLDDPQKILALPESGKGSNPMIAYPLRLHDCSLVSDGAAALVLAPTDEAVKSSSRIVEISGIGMASDRLAENLRDNLYELTAGKVAVKRSFEEANIRIGDADFAEVHDCFSINQLLTTEALGLSKDGEAGFDYINKKFGPDDDCPVNLSGGLKSKGHPVGATGASMHALAYKQLVGEPIGMAPDKKNPEVGIVFNVGGSGATNCVTTLKRIK
jgi:acetyl-CoA C-acetyltransferase